MSQYGARGRALAGQHAATILAHYYAGTTLGSKDPATTVRVLLLDGFAATADKPLVVHGRGGAWSIDGHRHDLPGERPADARPGRRRVDDVERCGSSSAGGTQLYASLAERRRSTVRPAAPRRRSSSTRRRRRTTLYRGFLRIRLTTTIRVIDDLGLDAYLRGVVPAEMPSTLAGRGAQGPGDRRPLVRRLPAPPVDRPFDLYDDTRSQVYRGVEAETAAPNAAIAATAGSRPEERRGGRERALPLDAAAAATENNENVFVVADRGDRRGHRSRTCGGRRDRAPDGTVVRRGVAVRDLEDGHVLADGAGRDLREGPADERRDRDPARSVAARRVGPADPA